MKTKKTLQVDKNDLSLVIKARKAELDDLFEEFLEKYKKTKIDKFGNVIDQTNPYLASTFFFKPINDVYDSETVYTPEQLLLVWDFYKDTIERINAEITLLQPTLSHFANFAGISLGTLQAMKNSPIDDSMKRLVNKIDTYIFDANMTLTQHKRLTERSTTYRMKIENEAIEKKSPTVNVNIGTKVVDLDAMNDRLKEIQALTKKQIEYEGK